MIDPVYTKFGSVSSSLINSLNYIDNLQTEVELRNGESNMEIEELKTVIENVYLRVQELQVKILKEES